MDPHATEHLPDDPRRARKVRALLVVLSLTAGSTDIVCYLGLGGLFTAHITGNLAVLAAQVGGGNGGHLAQVLSVPVFMLVVFLTTLLAGALTAIGRSALGPLLLLQFVLLAGLLGLCASVDVQADVHSIQGLLAGMLGVSAMAVQSTFVQVSLKGAPSTAVMTSNCVRFALAVGKLMLRERPLDIAEARRDAGRTLPVILGFAGGCGLGAACTSALALQALILPAGLALLALLIGSAVNRDRRAEDE